MENKDWLVLSKKLLLKLKRRFISKALIALIFYGIYIFIDQNHNTVIFNAFYYLLMYLLVSLMINAVDKDLE